MEDFKMGYMRHHAIIVTSWDREAIIKAHKKAIKFCNKLVSPIIQTEVNNYDTFIIVPDGSKEGWDTSHEGDIARNNFITWIDKQRYNDGSTNFNWVEVQYGDDNYETKITRDSDYKARKHFTQNA